ncbi:MAG: hypothetical protein ISR00_02655 [Flavobacteriales bacterium]|nr:hypothetical protein [Flavobacteriales bacterium]MBL6872832.1 hypothetical protein [Flavobacteriales bacterium]
MKNYLLICIILLSCTPQEFLISSTYQHWVGGRKESGSGTNYKFTLVTPEGHTNFKVKGIYAHNTVLRFSMIPENFEKGDTLKINAYKSQEKYQTDSIDAIIIYQLFDKDYPLPIQEMTELDKLYYP